MRQADVLLIPTMLRHSSVAEPFVINRKTYGPAEKAEVLFAFRLQLIDHDGL